jgi:glycosyltransferase involved in cell wall biosynthesis
VLQRLEPEKDTITAIQAWALSGLATEGWTLRIVGDGSQRLELEQMIADESISGVEFSGWTRDVRVEFARAGMLLAPTPAEGFGLSVVEAMSCGLPVVATASGGHRETIALACEDQTFASSDAVSAAKRLSEVGASDELRADLSLKVRRFQRQNLTTEGATALVLAEYQALDIPHSGVVRRRG